MAELHTDDRCRRQSLLRIGNDSSISTLATFATRTVGTASFESVTTGLAVGPDGAYYVGELTGVPFSTEAAQIYRVASGGGAPTVFSTRFTMISDLALARTAACTRWNMTPTVRAILAYKGHSGGGAQWIKIVSTMGKTMCPLRHHQLEPLLDSMERSSTSRHVRPTKRRPTSECSAAFASRRVDAAHPEEHEKATLVSGINGLVSRAARAPVRACIEPRANRS
ncbi:MAG TPA: hypothetical protein VK439_02355 [Rubrivivax sp.]|nr:hypothetical protein [Rubrivivax sp.]